MILPQIASLTQFVSQMKNLTRKVDLTQALLETYTNIIYTPFSKHSISSSVLPGLRYIFYSPFYAQLTTNFKVNGEHCTGKSKFEYTLGNDFPNDKGVWK